MLTKDTWYYVLNEIREFAKTDKELTHINLEIKIRKSYYNHKKISTVKLNLTTDD
jgi:hypothetical protein